MYIFIIITVLIGMILVTAVLDPILSYLGLDSIAKPFFFNMHMLCARTPSHSFYFFGHQLCFCERCCAIYRSRFLGGITFQLSGAVEHSDSLYSQPESAASLNGFLYH